jgi:hypothetical protein
VPSNDELEAAKSLVREKYLGKAGIHGVGLRRSKEAVTLYVDPTDQPERQELLRSIEKEIEPVKLLVVEEGRASIK